MIYNSNNKHTQNKPQYTIQATNTSLHKQTDAQLSDNKLANSLLSQDVNNYNNLSEILSISQVAGMPLQPIPNSLFNESSDIESYQQLFNNNSNQDQKNLQLFLGSDSDSYNKQLLYYNNSEQNAQEPLYSYSKNSDSSHQQSGFGTGITDQMAKQLTNFISRGLRKTNPIKTN